MAFKPFDEGQKLSVTVDSINDILFDLRNHQYSGINLHVPRANPHILINGDAERQTAFPAALQK